MGLDTVELVMEIERAFAIEIPDAAAERLRTVGEMYQYVRAHVSPDDWPPVAPGRDPVLDPVFDPVWQLLLDVIEKETGVERRRLVPSASFIDDLNLD